MAVLTSTHNLYFGAKIRKKYVYSCLPQFSYIKVGFKGVYTSRTCFPGEASMKNRICNIKRLWNGILTRQW